MSQFKETPAEERPYERAIRYGVETLTDTELLAVLLRTGTSNLNVMELCRSLLDMGGKNEGITGLLHHTCEEYRSMKGIGKVRAVELLALGEFSKRIWKRDAVNHLVCFNEPALCARYYMQDMRHLEQEELRIAFMDTRHNLTADQILTRGTVNSSMVSVREIMISALKHRAVNMILIHNHPSGNPAPSDDDIRVTRQVSEAAKLIGIGLADHIIIGDNNYYSFKEWGTL